MTICNWMAILQWVCMCHVFNVLGSGGMCVSACTCFYSSCVHLLHLSIWTYPSVCVWCVYTLQCVSFMAATDLHTFSTISLPLPASAHWLGLLSNTKHFGEQHLTISILITRHVNIVAPCECKTRNKARYIPKEVILFNEKVKKKNLHHNGDNKQRTSIRTE